MILIDSSVWIANLRDQETPATRWLRQSQPGDGIILGDLILLEILQGAKSDRHAEELRAELQDYGIVPILDQTVTIGAATNFRHLRSRGITVRKTVDLIIATYCLVYGHRLLHQDRDFHGFEQHFGLDVFHPS
jgi:predicted nucleic acid-binding protein